MNEMQVYDTKRLYLQLEIPLELRLSRIKGIEDIFIKSKIEKR